MTTPPPVDPRLALAAGAKPRKKTRPVFIALALLLVLYFLGTDVYDAFSKVRMKRQQAMANLSQEAETLKSQFKPGEDLSTPENAEKVDRTISRLSEAAGAVDARMKALVRTLMEEMASIGKGVSASNGKLTAAGGIEPATMPTLASVNQRLAILEDCEAVAKEMLRRTKGIEQLVRQTGASNGLSAREIDDFVRGINKNGKLERFTRIREIDVELFAQFTQLVTLLRDRFGGWEVIDGKIAFGNAPQGTVARYTEIGGKIDTLAQEQEVLLKQVSGQ